VRNKTTYRHFGVQNMKNGYNNSTAKKKGRE
jgi:hypothetical protein